VKNEEAMHRVEVKWNILRRVKGRSLLAQEPPNKTRSSRRYKRDEKTREKRSAVTG
jgi:hypothetical protein